MFAAALTRNCVVLTRVRVDQDPPDPPGRPSVPVNGTLRCRGYAH